MIIFGMKTRLTRNSEEEPLPKCCPSCQGDLSLHDLKSWFTLYFIPLIPINKIDSCYKCENCEQTYKEEIKNMLVSPKDQAKIKRQMEKQFAVTLAACMTHMAKIDGKICKKEKAMLNKYANDFKKYKTDIQKTIEKVSKSKNDQYVMQMLTEAREVLTASGLSTIIAQVVRVLLADGKIDAKEKQLLKEYLLVCGIPKGTYKEIISKVKKNMKT